MKEKGLHCHPGFGLKSKLYIMLGSCLARIEFSITRYLNFAELEEMPCFLPAIEHIEHALLNHSCVSIMAGTEKLSFSSMPHYISQEILETPRPGFSNG